MNMEREEAVDRHLAAAQSLASVLHRLDPRLELWKASDRLPAPLYGAKPGFWHVVRRNDPPAPDSYIVITDAGLGKMEGGFREPDSGVIHELQRMDSWASHWKLPTDDYDAVEAELQRERDRKADQRAEEFVANVKTGLRLPGDGGFNKRLWGKGKPKGLVGS